MWISDQKLKKLIEQEFNYGVDVGESLGECRTAEKAQRAYDAGKIEWWLEKMRPKTREEWEEWEKNNGPINSDRF